MTTQERKNRIIARGEHSNHSHVIIGDATIERNERGEIIVQVGNEGATLAHILESNWMQGEVKWTKEHYEIALEPNKRYEFIQQQEYSPLDDIVRDVID